MRYERTSKDENGQWVTEVKEYPDDLKSTVPWDDRDTERLETRLDPKGISTRCMGIIIDEDGIRERNE